MGRRKIMNLPTSMFQKSVNHIGKLFGMWDKKTKTQSKTHIQPNIFTGVPVFIRGTESISTKHTSRRQIVLNRYLTEIISDVLANNDMNRQLSEMKISITGIEAKIWSKGVSIFFTSDSKKLDSEVEDSLVDIKTDIIKALALRKLVGRVPQVNFVWDRNAKFEEFLDSQIEKAKEKPPSFKITSDISILAQDKSLIESVSGDLGANDISDKKFKGFTFPPDMTNTCYGLDYINLYNKVGVKFTHGRAESERKLGPNHTLTPPTLFSGGGFIHPPKEDMISDNILDPATRLKQMKKFVINQRKKSERLARESRKAQLLHHSNISWEVHIQDDDSGDNEETTSNLKN